MISDRTFFESEVEFLRADASTSVAEEFPGVDQTWAPFRWLVIAGVAAVSIVGVGPIATNRLTVPVQMADLAGRDHPGRDQARLAEAELVLKSGDELLDRLRRNLLGAGLDPLLPLADEIAATQSAAQASDNDDPVELISHFIRG